MDEFLCVVLHLISCMVYYGCIQQQIFINIIPYDILGYRNGTHIFYVHPPFDHALVHKLLGLFQMLGSIQ